MGGHARGTTGIRFVDCRVAHGARLLGPGDGFKAAMDGINVARVNVAAMCCGMLRAGLDCAVDYVSTRRAFGRATSEFQGLQWMLADTATQLAAARLLTYDAAARQEGAGDGRVAAAHAKKFATRAALEGLAQCMQTMGAAGTRTEYPLARHLACAKLAAFIDGTTEIQNVVISRALFAGSS